MNRPRSLAEIYPDEAGFIGSMLVSPEAKLARLRQMIREQTPRVRKPSPYKGSKAAKRASRKRKP